MERSFPAGGGRSAQLRAWAAGARVLVGRVPWRHLDPALVLAVLGLAGLGLAAVYSATFAALRDQGLPAGLVVRRQALSLGLGLVGLGLAALLDYRRWQGYAAVVFALTLAALAAVLTPLGSAAHGSQSWFDLGVWQVQPSEYAKPAVIVVLAALLGGGQGRPGGRRVGLALGVVALVSGAILLQPDFGTCMVFVAILFGMLLVGGVAVRWLLVGILAGGLAVTVLLRLDLLESYQEQRLTAFVNPAADPAGRAFTYNSRQALIAVGSGGLTGKGYLRGSQTSLRFVPEQHTDFVFTVIGEELGFAGSVLVLALTGAVLWRGLRAAAGARDRFGVLLAAGVVSMLAFQAFVSVGMTVGLAPVTGIPLPFVSYGGSSLVATMVAVGLVLSVRARRYG